MYLKIIWVPYQLPQKQGDDQQKLIVKTCKIDWIKTKDDQHKLSTLSVIPTWRIIYIMNQQDSGIKNDQNAYQI